LFWLLAVSNAFQNRLPSLKDSDGMMTLQSNHESNTSDQGLPPIKIDKGAQANFEQCIAITGT
jgi:hypothetical protein